MGKALLFSSLLLTAVNLLTAQDEPKHSLSEIQVLLKKSKADTSRINLLIEAANTYLLRPGMEKKDFDSALLHARQAMDLSNSLNNLVAQGRCYTLYCQIYRENNEKVKARNYADKAIAIFEKANEKERLGDAYFDLSHFYDVYSDSEWVFKVKYAEMGERIYRENGFKQKQAAALKHLGDFYQIKEKDSAALKCLHEALAVYKSIGYEKLQGIYDLMGNSYYFLYDNNQALKYGLLAVQTAERLKTGGIELGTIYNRVGVTYYRLTQYREAVDCFNKAFSIALENKDTSAATIISPNVINCYLRLKKQNELLAFLRNARFIYDKSHAGYKAIYLSAYIQAHLLTGDHNKAAPFVEPIIKLVKDTNNTGRLISLHRAVIPYYLAAGQYREMYKYLAADVAICKRQNIMSGLADDYLWWYKADSALGNLAAAIEHHKLYKEASDSLLRNTANQQINQLNIQHETFKKDQEIAIHESNIELLTNQAKLQKAQLRQARLVRNLTYGLAALLLTIVGLLLYAYSLKQRSNKKLQAHQQEIDDKNTTLEHVVDQKEKLLVEKEWLLKEVHHRVKNNMQIVMSLLNTQSAYLEKDALTAIKESQHRMQAMSLIHQKLYLADNVTSINMNSYIHELAGYLRDSYASGRHIDYNLDIEEVELDVSQSVPVGLILNEAITNSIKYAFPDQHSGRINITMKRTQDDKILLRISDNGVGMPAGHVTKKNSFGLNLVRGLVKQLDGTIKILSEKGLHMEIAFPAKAIMRSGSEREVLATT